MEEMEGRIIAQDERTEDTWQYSLRPRKLAEYSTSSTLLESLCISSMKSTSRSPRFVRSAARSPERSMAGPDVMRKFTLSSLAMMPARVVLPRPGGP